MKGIVSYGSLNDLTNVAQKKVLDLLHLTPIRFTKIMVRWKVGTKNILHFRDSSQKDLHLDALWQQIVGLWLVLVLQPIYIRCMPLRQSLFSFQ